MLKITSKDNEKIKLLKKLGQKKYREKHGKFLVENWNIIKDAGVDFEALFVTEDFLKKGELSLRAERSNPDEIATSLLDKLGAPRNDIKNIFLITKEINKSFTSLDTPSGICAIYKKSSPLSHSRESGDLEIDFKKSVIYLNEINDPGNLGTILRSAVAFGFKNIVLDEKCADLYNPKTISAAKDAVFKLNFSFDKNLKILEKIKKEMKILSTDILTGTAITPLSTRSTKWFRKQNKFCLVFGNEARGVEGKIKKLADDFIKIQMSEEMESLNVAVSAGIILHEFYKNQKVVK